MAVYPFGEATAWLAFETTDVELVKALVRADGWREVSWEEGVTAAYEPPDDMGSVVVTPPIDGFVLVMATGFMRQWGDAGFAWDAACPPAHVGTIGERAAEQAFEHRLQIHFFLDDRGAGRYGWGRVRFDGEGDETDAGRELLIASDSFVSFGKLTEEERAVAAQLESDPDLVLDPTERRAELQRLFDAKLLPMREPSGVNVPDEDHVPPEDLSALGVLLTYPRPDLVAARWGVAPHALDERPDAARIAATCWLGTRSF